MARLGHSRGKGFFALIGGFNGLALYLLSAVALCSAIFVSEQFVAHLVICLLLSMGFAVLAGLLNGIAAGVTATVVLLLVAGGLCASGAGLFHEMPPVQAWILALAMVLISGAFSLLAAFAVGLQKRTAELAGQKQNLLLKVFDALPIGIWVRARDGRTLFVNERWASFSPTSAEAILASDSKEPPVDLGSNWNKELSEVLKSDDGAVRYQSIDLTDSRGRPSSMTLLTLRMFIEQEDDFGTLSLLVDETALRLYEEKVRQSEQNLQLALQNARMGFWDENLVTKEVWGDDNWYALIDAPRERGKSPIEVWSERLHPDDSRWVKAKYKEYYLSGSGSLRVEYRIRKGRGGYVWVQDNVRITEYQENGRPLRVMGTMQEISEQKQFEHELKQAKERAESANEAKSQFIATISHEIRTPLNAIIGLSSFLAEGELEEEQLDLAQTIYSSGKSLLLLVNDILDFSKIEAGRLDLEVQEFPLRLCFEDCVKLFSGRANEKNVELHLELSNKLPEFAAGDMERLRQIVQNLLANALKFTEVGEVHVSVRPITLAQMDEARRPDPLEPIGYLDQPDHEYLEVRIQDTGIGIPEDRQHILFEAFTQVDASTTRKYGGTGLGLVICKRLVDAMGGYIWVDSKAGEGATFGFVVRTKFVRENHEYRGLTKTPFDPVDRIAEEHPCDILVIGPEEAMRPLILSCRQLGYAPHLTEDFEVNENAFRRRRYNVMFVWMGDERQALELARKVSASGHMLRPDCIIGCAPPDRTISLDRCRLSGMQEVVQENFRPRVVSDVILSALGAHG